MYVAKPPLPVKICFLAGFFYLLIVVPAQSKLHRRLAKRVDIGDGTAQGVRQ